MRLTPRTTSYLLLAWASLLVILAGAPEVYDQTLRLPTGNRRHTAQVAFLAALTGLLALLAIRVVRRWRWTFWLILVAFLFGVLRVPVAVLQITGILRVVPGQGQAPPVSTPARLRHRAV